jgi:hypothetical protein
VGRVVGTQDDAPFAPVVIHAAELRNRAIFI